MTLKKVINSVTGKYEEIEVFKNFNSNSIGFHTDRIEFVDEWDGTEEVLEFELMDEETYANSINANSCVDTDFEEWFGNKTAKILCVKIK